MKGHTMKPNRKPLATTTPKVLVHYGVRTTIGTTLLRIFIMMDMGAIFLLVYTHTGLTSMQTTCRVMAVTAGWGRWEATTTGGCLVAITVLFVTLG